MTKKIKSPSLNKNMVKKITDDIVKNMEDYIKRKLLDHKKIIIKAERKREVSLEDAYHEHVNEVKRIEKWFAEKVDNLNKSLIAHSQGVQNIYDKFMDIENQFNSTIAINDFDADKLKIISKTLEFLKNIQDNWND